MTTDSLARTTDKINEMVRRVSGTPCVMCGVSADGAEAFMPDAPKVWGAPEGKARVYVLALCSACVKSTTVAEREAWVWLHQGEGVRVAP